MSITDPIADMSTLIRNACRAGKDKVDIKTSRINESILKILKEKEFIQNYKRTSESKQGALRIYLKFTEDKKPAIRNIKRISKPGLRVYKKKDEIPVVLGGLGISIISTSRGLMADEEARKENLGGEVMLQVW